MFMIFFQNLELPTQIRDQVLRGVNPSIPSTDVNREYFVARMESKMMQDGGLSNHGKSISAAKEFLKNMNREEPAYAKSQSICVFYKQGKCQRGTECPFRHEEPISNAIQSSKGKLGLFFIL